MLPVETKQVGCTTLVAGGFGVAGAALIVTEVAPDSQPSLFLILIWYVPGAKPLLLFSAW